MHDWPVSFEYCVRIVSTAMVKNFVNVTVNAPGNIHVRACSVKKSKKIRILLFILRLKHA